MSIKYEGYIESSDDNKNDKFSRRTAIVMGAVGGASLLGGGIFLGRSLGQGERPIENPTIGIDTSDNSVEPEQFVDAPSESNNIITREITRDPAIYKGRLTPEEIHEAAEKSDNTLIKTLQIKRETVPSPDDYPPAFEMGLQNAFATGCTLQEVEPYLKLGEISEAQGTATLSYLSEMASKYDYLVYRSIFAADTVGFTVDEAHTKPTFTILQNSLRAARRRFIEEVRTQGNLDEVVKVEVLDHTLNRMRDNGGYSMDMNVRFTNDFGVNGSIKNYYSVEGLIGVGVKMNSNGTVGTTLAHDPYYTAPFEELIKI